MYNLKPMSVPEQNRLLEIEFYQFVKHLLDKYNRSRIIIDIINSLSQLFGCNVTMIQSLTSKIYDSSSIIIPDKEELAVMLYKSGMTVRKIRSTTRIHPQTMYRYLTQYIQAGQLEFIPRLDDEYFLQVQNFMLQLNEIMGWK